MASVTPHLHIGFVEFVVFGLYLLVWGFLLRVIMITWPNSIGKPLSFIH